MKLIKKILFPTNFSPNSKDELKNAISLSEKFGAELIVVHVLPDYPAWDSMMTKIQHRIEDSMNATESYLKDHTSLQFKTLIETGNYADKIVEVANREKVNMILLGAGTPKDHLNKLGTSSEKIIRSSVIPIWVLGKDASLNIETILCPVDFSEASKKAVENAVHVARLYEAKLVVMHITESIADEYSTLGVDLSEETAEYKEFENENFKNFLKQFDFSDVNWQSKIKVGKADELIKSEIKDDVIDLLIMGTHGRNGLQRFFLGSVTEKVIKSVPCSFITIKSKDMIQLELEENITNIEESYQEAVRLAKNGFLKEALDELNHCLELNQFNVKAWHGKADIYERMGNMEKSKECNLTAEKIQRSIWEQQIEADLRRQNSMFK